jgi:hypothetical protein
MTAWNIPAMVPYRHKYNKASAVAAVTDWEQDYGHIFENQG